MSGTVLTPEQHAAVARRTGDVALTASAGSGKTRVLTERFVAAVVQDGIDPARILAITFTEKAALELGERVRTRLREHGREADARAAEAGWIGTVHGWAAGILRAHPLIAGIDPRFRVLDEIAAERLERAAWDDALAGWVRDGGDDAEELLAAYEPDRLCGTIRSAHAELRARGLPVALPPPPPRPCPAAVQRAAGVLRRAAVAVREELGDAAVPPRATSALTGCDALVAAALDPVPVPAAVGALALPRGNGNGLKGPACEHYREAFTAFEQACLDLRAVRAVPVIDALVRRHAAAYADGKASAGALDFADLELRARDLLRDHPPVRARWRERFVLAMVDEFQDINPLQLELLGLVTDGNLFTVGDPLQAIYGFRHADVALIEERSATLAPRGSALGLTENFRSAPEVVHAIDAAFAGLLGAAPLRPGRGPDPRDGPRVEVLLTEQEGWDAAELLPVGVPAPAPAWRLAEARLLAQRVAELVRAGRPAGDVVVLLRATTDLGTYARALEDAGVPTYLVGGRGFWARREVQDLTAWLSVLANPRDELRLYEVLVSPLVGVHADALVALGSAARDPWWELSDPGPGSPLELLGSADAARLAAFAAHVRAERGEATRRPLAELIERALVSTGYDLHLLRLPGGPRRLANVRKLMRLAREWEATEGRDLRGFLDLVTDLAGDDGGTGGGREAREGEAPVDGEDLGAVRLMTIHRAKGLEFPVVVLADLGRRRYRDDAAVLRIGRDGELGLRVAVAGGGRSRPALAYDRLGAEARARESAEERRLFYVGATRAQEQLVLSGAVRFAAWPDPENSASAPVSWLVPAFAPDLVARVEAGEREGVSLVDAGEREGAWRVEAGEREGVSRPHAGPRDEVSSGTAEVAWRVSLPGEVGAVLRRGSLAPVPEPPGDAAPPLPVTARAPEAPALAPALESVSFSALEEYRRCGYRFHAERVLGLPLGEGDRAGRPDPDPDPDRPVARPVPSDGAGGVLPATVRGTLVHALLEELPLRAPLTPTDARVDAVAAREGVVLAPGERDAVTALVSALARAPLFSRLADARRVAREEGFAFVLDGLLVTGVLDALVRERGSALVVDFKTNALLGRAPAEIVEAAYAVQRLVYALALLRDGAEEVEVAFVFLERPETPVVRRFASSDTEGLEAELRALVAGLTRGTFPVAAVPGPELCAGCPVRGTLCSHPYSATLAG